MSKHTPAPWAIRGEARYAKFGIVDASAKSIAAFPSTSKRNDEEREANARLIAAAPELLDALKLADDLLRNGLTAGDDDLQKMFESIAKAEGKHGS